MAYYVFALGLFALVLGGYVDRQTRMVALFLLIVGGVFFSGLASGVHIDQAHYYSLFSHSRNDTLADTIKASRFEIGFVVPWWLLARIGISFQFANVLVSALIVSSFLYLCSVARSVSTISLLVFLTGSYLPLSLQTLRQGIAVAMFFLAVACIIEKRKYRAIILVTAATFVHGSAIIGVMWCALSLVLRRPFFKWMLAFFALGLVLLNPVDFLVEYSITHKTAAIVGRIEEFSRSELHGGVYSSAINIARVTVLLAVAWFTKRRSDERIDEYVLWLMCFALGSILVLGNMSILVNRAMKFFDVDFLVLGRYWQHLRTKKKRFVLWAIFVYVIIRIAAFAGGPFGAVSNYRIGWLY